MGDVALAAIEEPQEPARAVSLAARSKIPRLREFITRRLASK